MKKLLFLIVFAMYMFTLSAVEGLFTINVYAQTSTPSPTGKSDLPTENETINQQINDLKNRIASRVAELKLVEKRGIIGEVTDSSSSQITVSDLKGNKRFIDVDELTRFTSLDEKGSFGISDITKNTNIGVLGLYNKESRRILARFVKVVNFPQIIHGTIESIDTESFVIKVKTEDGKTLSLDMETTTKTSSYTKDAGFVRSGFSKIKEKDRIIAIGRAYSKDQTKLEALRITLLPVSP